MLLQNTEKPHHWELIRGEASCLFPDYLLLYVQSEISRSSSEITPVVRSSYILSAFCFRFLVALILLLWYNLNIVKSYLGLEVILWLIILTFHISKTAAQSWPWAHLALPSRKVQVHTLSLSVSSPYLNTCFRFMFMGAYYFYKKTVKWTRGRKVKRAARTASVWLTVCGNKNQDAGTAFFKNQCSAASWFLFAFSFSLLLF